MNIEFKIHNNKILKKVKIIKPSKYIDHRGFIYTNFNKKLEKKILPKNYRFNHCKINFRKKKVLVGVHYDLKTWKLISCLKGKILHVVSCLDSKDKKNLYKSISFILDNKKNLSILVPPNYGNSFYCYKDSIILYQFAYRGKYLDHKDQKTISWSDKRLNIKWLTKNPILSKRDSI
jgi:dTDP-4-dehydrorhamnose 3,5-epimerase